MTTAREIAEKVLERVDANLSLHMDTYSPEKLMQEMERIIQQALDEEVGRELDAHAEANAQMIRDAVAAERERCAGIAQNWPGDAGAWIAKAVSESK